MKITKFDMDSEVIAALIILVAVPTIAFSELSNESKSVALTGAISGAIGLSKKSAGGQQDIFDQPAFDNFDQPAFDEPSYSEDYSSLDLESQPEQDQSSDIQLLTEENKQLRTQLAILRRQKLSQ